MSKQQNSEFDELELKMSLAGTNPVDYGIQNGILKSSNVLPFLAIFSNKYSKENKYISYASLNAALKYPEYSRYINEWDNLFKGYTNDSIDLSTFNFENAESFNGLFSDNRCIKHIKFNNTHTKKLVYMSCIFENCTSLERIELNNFDTSSVKFLDGAFNNCQSLKELDLSSFNTKEVKVFKNMFNRCTSLEKLKIDNFNSTNVLSIQQMFKDCKSLKELKLGRIKFTDSSSINQMFRGCTSLEYIDLSKFVFPFNCPNSKLFLGDDNLKEIRLPLTKNALRSALEQPEKIIDIIKFVTEDGKIIKYSELFNYDIKD